MTHELWVENDNEQTFCLAGPHGDDARKELQKGAKLVWKCEASSHFEAMVKYYDYMGWGVYKSDYPEQDKQTYEELGWQ